MKAFGFLFTCIVAVSMTTMLAVVMIRQLRTQVQQLQVHA